jgi:hypothetical protein
MMYDVGCTMYEDTVAINNFLIKTSSTLSTLCETRKK